MDASDLHRVLLAHAQVDKQQLNQVYDQLTVPATVANYRSALVHANVLTYRQIMEIFVTHGLAVKANAVIEKVQQQRKSITHFKPTGHQQKFKVTDNDILCPELTLANDQLTLSIPAPKEDKLSFMHSDERQAVHLAIEIAKQGDAKDAEQILLETLDTFKQSTAAMQTLCWLYLSTAHLDCIQEWAKKELSINQNSPYTLETLSLTEQKLGKHFLACAHYQQLLKQARIKPIWYLLLAVSQEYGACHYEAIENYTIYMKIGNNPQHKAFAEQHLQRLSQL